MKSWFVYIITNYNNTVIYTGITNDLEKRRWEHRSGIIKSSFSNKYRLYKLVWFEEFNSPNEAIAAEKKIKGWIKKKKLNLIRSKNPKFLDLSSASLDSSTSGLRMTSKILLIASTNPGKIREIKEILKGIPFELRTLDDIDLSEEIQETGKSFAENAIIKAKTTGEKIGMLTLSEDSGLEVDVLNGRPGIRSARYAEGSDLDRINKLLKELKDVPKEKRTARFRAVAALYIPVSSHPEVSTEGSSERSERRNASLDSSSRRYVGTQNDKGGIFTFAGVSEGYITEKPIGKNGFGYDPVFFNLDLGKTNAQATLKEKNRVSHRARALQKVKDFLIRP